MGAWTAIAFFFRADTTSAKLNTLCDSEEEILMIIGQTIHATYVSGGSPTSADFYYSPWFPRGGNGMQCTIEVMQISADCEFIVEVQTKNSEEDDTIANDTNNSWSTGAITARGKTVKEAGADIAGEMGGGSSQPGFKELVRFRYKVAYAAGGDGSDADWVHFRVLNPSWYSNGA